MAKNRDSRHGSPGSETERAQMAHDDAVAAEQTAFVRSRAAGEVEGVFGPRSVVWTVYRETAQLWSGVRALLLEIAHPAVAAGVDQHSTFSKRYVGRLIKTFGMPYQMVFGDLRTALGIAANIHHRHHTIRGVIPAETTSSVAGMDYRANDPAFMFWVQATLLDTGLRVFETLVRPLSSSERRQFYDEHKLFSAMMAIPASYVPPTIEAFDEYFHEMLHGGTLQVGPTAARVWRLISEAPAPLGTLSSVSTLIRLQDAASAFARRFRHSMDRSRGTRACTRGGGTRQRDATNANGRALQPGLSRRADPHCARTRRTSWRAGVGRRTARSRDGPCFGGLAFRQSQRSQRGPTEISGQIC